MCVTTGTRPLLHANRHRLRHAGLRAEVRFGRHAIVVGEVGPRGRATSTTWITSSVSREVRRLVIETRRHAPRALAQPVRNQRAHARDLVGRGAPIGVADDVDPRGVEADVAADVHRETGHGERAHLLRDVERSAAVGVEDLGGHALREHVHRGRQRVGRRVTMNVDEAGRHEQAARVDRAWPRWPSSRSPIAAMKPFANPDIGVVARVAAAVDHRAVANDDVERLRLGMSDSPGQQRKKDESRAYDLRYITLARSTRWDSSTRPDAPAKK